ncbi:MAG TPA: hypothetical protein VEA99_04050 [Gemmatimonadaceae bacterium]|nr:hypothetical protein [Gemmatimonadaceae bacterium]
MIRRSPATTSVVALGLIALAASCDEPARPLNQGSVPVEPTRAPPAFVVTGPVQGDISGTYPVPLSDAVMNRGTVSLGTTLASGQLYKVTATGRVLKQGLWDGTFPNGTYTTSSGPGGVWYGGGCGILGLGIFSGAGASYGFPCPTPDVDTHTIYRLLYGATEARRQGTTGNAYACGPQRNALCYTHSDISPMTVALQRVQASLTASPTYVAAKLYQRVVITALPVSSDAAAPMSILPVKNMTWRFTSDAGVSSVLPCSSSPCVLYPSTSGWVQISALVNGEPQEVNVRVKVFTNFTVTVDSSRAAVGSRVTFTARLDGEPAAVRSWAWSGPVSEDTTHSCAPASACAHPLRFAGRGVMTGTIELAGGSTLSASSSVEAVDRLVLRCHAPSDSSRTSIVRRASVACVGRMASRSRFSVSAAEAEPEGFTSMPITGVMSPDSTQWTTQGPALVSSSVRVTWRSGAETGTEPAHFTVTADSSFPDPQAPSPTTYEEEDLGFVARAGAGDGVMTFGKLEVLTLRGIRPDPRRFAAALVPATSGPNEGLMAPNHVPLTTPSVVLNSVFSSNRPLDPGNWKTDQNGGVSRFGGRMCDASDIPSPIIPDILAHEGIAPTRSDSHLADYNQGYIRHAAGQKLEGIVVRVGEQTEAIQQALGVITRLNILIGNETREGLDNRWSARVYTGEQWKCEPDMNPDTPDTQKP